MTDAAPVPPSALTPAALAGEALLRVLAAEKAPTAQAQIAHAAKRPPKNIGRELANLVGAGLIGDDWRLTPTGRDALAALDRAAGRDAVIRVKAADLRPNPMNPRKAFDQGGLEGLADSTLNAGDFEQPLRVSPPDILGQRIIWAGERRWRAAGILEGRAAAGDEQALSSRIVREGLPCVEREANEAQALFIAVVENGQREGLSALEDAQALAALQDATGWSARQVAYRTGRAREGSERGVKYVQDQIRIARNATPEALAQYAADGSWDRLLASVREAAAGAADEQSDAQPSLIPEGEAPADQAAAQPDAAPAAPVTELTAAQVRILAELAWATSRGEGRWCPEGGVEMARLSTVFAPVGKYWTDLSAVALQQDGLIAFRHNARPFATVTDEGWNRLQALDLIPVDVVALERVRVREAREGRDPGGLDPSDPSTPWTEWLNVPADPPSPDAGDEAAEAATVVPAPASPAPGPEAVRAANLALAVLNGAPIGPAVAALWPAGTFVAADTDPGVVLDGAGGIACVVDVDNHLTDAEALARAAVIAAALNAAAIQLPQT